MQLTWYIGGIKADPASWANIPVPAPEAPPAPPSAKRRRGTHPRANAKTQAIVDFLRVNGKARCQEIAKGTSQPRHNTSSRLCELRQQGRVIKYHGWWCFNRFAPKAVRDA